MKSLWREWPSLKQTIAAQQRLLLLLDFDGTLSPLAETPAAAKLPPRVRRLLVRLVSLPGVHVAVISGRSVTYLRRMIRLRPIFYSGNHGLELAGPQTSYCHPKAARLRKRLRRWARSWRDSVDRVPGALLENIRRDAIWIGRFPRARSFISWALCAFPSPRRIEQATWLNSGIRYPADVNGHSAKVPARRIRFDCCRGIVERQSRDRRRRGRDSPADHP